MSVSLDVLAATVTLSDLQTTIRQTEELGFRLVSVTAGFVQGAPGNLATFSQGTSGPPPAPIALEIIDGSLSKDAQEAQLNGSGKSVVCYGSVYVEGQAQNVAAYR